MVRASATSTWLDATAPDENLDGYVWESSGADANRNDIMERTNSQAAEHIQICSVLERLEGQKVPIHELSRTVSELGRGADLAAENSNSANLKDVAARVDQARKKARNFGEDLLEDMLSLDGLSGLVTEDRAKRKAAIVGIESLLEDVDATEQLLGGLHKKLQADLSLLAGPEDALKPDTQLQSSVAQHPERMEEIGQAAQHLSVPDPAAQEPPGLSSPELRVPPPSRELWESVRLPVRFRTRETASGYEIRASAPGLHLDDVSIDFGEDGSSFIISGLLLPTPRRADRMHRQLTYCALQQTQGLPHKAHDSASHLAEFARQGYAELSQGGFGRFSETFQIPQDADASGIQASYREGVLRVIIPKRTRRVAPRTAYGGFGDRYWGC
mmetsp:Transcript_15567/g.42040  ORF Transcript_15567/g.42040 Transcript_15567/m.42040 type:complete len:386 (+) Transcript_15567:91-1248(+)